ncbi:UDP-glucose_4-epimerase [Hexamita inflata]|uniref:UDP-glucose 4-epimerase n=1 Tax=Hexamita inflata TaxID=28002 RepID=A0ABP1L3M5_9EUKA
MTSILVAGGAGYIGSHITRLLLQMGYQPIIFDNLSTGHIESVPEGVKIVVGDVRDTALVTSALLEHKIEAVVHLCASSIVSESVSDPLKYFDNNVCGAISLLKAMSAASVSKLVFSSTAAVYGEPTRVPIHESDQKVPINPYGESKLMIETIIRSTSINCVAFRYFNVAGAGFGVGEMHDCETHLIPCIIKNTLYKKPAFIFGTDYNTADGTCVRDYVHVVDLAVAHELGLQQLLKGQTGFQVYNLGTKNGMSVKEIINEIQKLINVEVVLKERRPGDPAVLVANADKAEKELHWKAERGAAEIVKDAVTFHVEQENTLRQKKQ